VSPELLDAAARIARSRIRLEKLRRIVGQGPVVEHEAGLLARLEETALALLAGMGQQPISSDLLAEIAGGFAAQFEDDAERAVAAAVLAELLTGTR
jgi:hypothetical protein